MPEKLNRKQVENHIKTIKQEIEKAQAWLAKKEETTKKHIEKVQAKGYLKDFNYNEITSDTKSYVWNEADKATEEKAIKTVINSIWTIYNAVTDVMEKQKFIERYTNKYLPKYEKMLAEFGEKTEAQIASEKMKQAEKDVNQLVKKEYKNWSCKSLDEWLENYRKDLLEWIQNSKDLKDYQRSRSLNDLDNLVDEQRYNIILRSYKHVGKLIDIKFSHIGADGSFNGTVIGEKGTANMQTILAGGYNIQRLHYRIIVK